MFEIRKKNDLCRFRLVNGLKPDWVSILSSVTLPPGGSHEINKVFKLLQGVTGLIIAIIVSRDSFG